MLRAGRGLDLFGCYMADGGVDLTFSRLPVHVSLFGGRKCGATLGDRMIDALGLEDPPSNFLVYPKSRHRYSEDCCQHLSLKARFGLYWLFLDLGPVRTLY